MKRAAFSLLSLCLGFSVLGSFRTTPVARPTLPVRHVDSASGTLARALAVVVPVKTPIAARDADDEDRAALRRKVRSEEAGTYIDDILLERDSSVARWPDRHGTPLTVWIQPTSRVQDFIPGLVTEVRSAFDEWDALHLPVRFTFLADSAHADVHVTWIDHFNEPISGRTRWTRDDDWLITNADITLAVHHFQGELLDEDAMRAMALHEIGHLIGLDHTTDTLSIMAPRVRVRSLSSADRATARLIYSLPAGPLN
ncbi:MAG TPA: matrixin family metalloprotease [Gemmatimonadaceae bacterium]|nr:matrixin family metalloprotease [Gemmatimonadaceae bacterium]